MTKRIISLLLVLLLLPLAAFAEASTTTIMMDDEDDEGLRVQSATTVGDKLYLLASGGELYARTATDATLADLGALTDASDFADMSEVKEGETPVDHLFGWNDALYGFCLIDGSWYKLLNDAGELAPQKQEQALTLLSAPYEQGNVQLTGAFAQGDWLYLSGNDYTSSMPSFSYRVNLQTGERKDFATKNIYRLAPWGDGLLACYLYDITIAMTAASNEALQAPVTFGLFDPEKDQMTTSFSVTVDNVLGGYAVSGVCGGANAIYYACGSRVYGVDMVTGEQRTSAYTGEGMYGSIGAAGQTMYLDGCFVTVANNSLSVLSLDTEAVKQGALRIFGEFGGKTHKAFVKAHPEIPVDVSGDYTSDIDALTQAMVADSDAYDVLLLSLSYMPVERLIQKGYCTPLDDYPQITDAVSQMLPMFSDALTVDGKLYGAPVSLAASGMGVNIEKWKELGLTEDDLPKTYAELYDFVANWMYDYGEDHPDLPLFDYGQVKSLLFSQLINEYMCWCEYRGDKLRFNTDVFKTLMAGFSAIDFTGIDKSEEGEESFYYNPDSLFNFSYMYSMPWYNDDNMQPLMLGMTEGDQPMIPASIGVLLINPKTTKLDEAVEYVSYYVNHLPAEQENITLFSDHNEPVISKSTQKAIEELKASVAQKQEMLDAASAENKASVQADLDSLTADLAEAEKNLYTVSAEDVTAYRETIQPLLYVIKQNILNGSGSESISEINGMLMQYLAGTMDLDKLVTELDSRISLMEMDND